MTQISCPSCYTQQDVPLESPGFKCSRCGTETLAIACGRCGAATLFHGTMPRGNQVLMFRCSSCNKKNYISIAALRETRERVRVAARVQKADEKTAKEQQRQEAQTRQESRATEVEQKNEYLENYVNRLQSLLKETLEVDDYIDFETFKEVLSPPAFDPGDLAKSLDPPQLALPPEPKRLGRLVPGSKVKYEQDTQAAKAAYQRETSNYEAREAARVEQLEEAMAEHREEVRKLEQRVAAQHAEIDGLKQRFDQSDSAAIAQYFSRVLEASSYPDNLPRHTKMAFSPESKQLVIEFQLPLFDVIPEVKSYKYLKTRDEVTETARPLTQRKPLYASVIAQIAVRTLHEIFEADRQGKIDTVVFNGFVDTVDKGTGQPIHPYLVSVRTTRETFAPIDLSKVEPEACLKALSASMSRSPFELAPVRPVLDFNMVDPRFIEETDVLSELDTRPT